jgi:hypothetical protein
LEGVVIDPKENNLAIVNGKIVKTGDQLGEYTIGAISYNQVELTKGQEHLVLKLKRGGE